MSQNKSITPISEDDPLHIIRNNRHSRTNRRNKKVKSHDIHRFNMFQGSIPEKSEQWIDTNCPSFSQTIQNANVYRSQETPTPTPPLTPLNKSFHSKCPQPKSRRKSKSNNNNKKFKKKRKKYKNQKYKNNNTKKVKPLQIKQIKKSQIKQIKKTPQQTQLLLSIKQILTKTEYKTFENIVKLLHSMKDSNNIFQFEKRIMNPFIKLFDIKKIEKKYLLKQLKTIIPPFYQTYYKKKITQIERKTQLQILNLCENTEKFKKQFKKSKNKNINKNNDLNSLKSMTEPSYSQSLSQDWHCSLCNMCNMSQVMQCEACNGPKYNTPKPVQLSQKNTQFSQPLSQKKYMIVNGRQLDRIGVNDSGKLYDKLDELREILKNRYNIRQLHLVYSEPVLNLLSKYAPIEISQLKYFDIMPMKIDKYGNDIVNIIKEYLHENGIISPFLRQSQTPPPPPMFGKRYKNNNYTIGRYINCRYCFSLFKNAIIDTHEMNCAMRDICSNNSLNLSLDLDVDKDLELINEMNANNPIIIDSDHENGNNNGNDNGNDVNMNELDEIGFLTLSELNRVQIDFNNDKKEDIDNKMDDICNDVNYFDGIDDNVFTQIIIEENNEKECIDDEFVKFEADEFVDDDVILKCLKQTEERILMKNNIKMELEERKLTLNDVKMKENEIKERRNRIEVQVNDLEKRLRELS